MKKYIFFLGLLISLIMACGIGVQNNKKYIYYLHGRIIEIQGKNAISEEYGKYEFDSIDAIELLVEIEKMLGFILTQEEKKQAMNVRTLAQVCDYIETIAATRA